MTKVLAQPEPNDFKLGDILLFNSDNKPYHGLYISHQYRQTAYRDSYGQSGYFIFKVLCFETGIIDVFYDTEFIKNLTGK